MAKIKYAVKENKKLGTHSFYAVPVVNGSLSFDEVSTRRVTTQVSNPRSWRQP